jgi:hypothetical protein
VTEVSSGKRHDYTVIDSLLYKETRSVIPCMEHGVNQKKWDWAADLSQITRYAATDPRGTGPNGRPPNPEQSDNLKQRLQQELQRATWAAGEIGRKDTQLGHDTDPRVVPKMVQAPVKKKQARSVENI